MYVCWRWQSERAAATVGVWHYLVWNAMVFAYDTRDDELEESRLSRGDLGDVSRGIEMALQISPRLKDNLAINRCSMSDYLTEGGVGLLIHVLKRFE